MDDEPDISALLVALRDTERRGDAVRELWPLLYEELKRRAVRAMARERGGHTLQPTALVHEAYERMVRASDVAWQDRSHFLAIAARVMRQVLVDHARKRDAERRGGDWTRITFDEPIHAAEGTSDVLELHLALERLEQLDARTAKVAELRLFAGATVPEIAEALDISARTVDNEWATARMWLVRALSDDPT